MAAGQTTHMTNDDPRKLRMLLTRALELAQERDVPSVMVGLAAVDGDLCFPEFVDYLQSAMRVEDGIFRMTRERVLLHLADTDRVSADEVVQRLLGGFHEEFPMASSPAFESKFFEVEPGAVDLTAKAVLTSVFPGPTLH